MSEPTGARRRPSPRLLAALVLVLLTGAGVLAGIALDRFMLSPAGHGHAAGQARHRGPDLLRELRPGQEAAVRRRMSARLTRELDLTAEQSARVDSILARQAGEWRDLRRDLRPRLERIFSSFRASLDTVLTPDQRERFRALRKRHRAARPD